MRFFAGFAMTVVALPVALAAEWLEVGLWKWLELIDSVDPARTREESP